MSEQVINSSRHFQIWKYTVGHSQLLLRSTKSAGLLTRIDVLFKGVEEFHLPTRFTGLLMTEVPESDARNIAQFHRPLVGKNAKLFQIKGADFLGYVIALAAFCHEDEGEYDEPSAFSANNNI